MSSRLRQSLTAGAIIALAGPPIGAIFVHMLDGLPSGVSADALLMKLGTLPDALLPLVVFAYILTGLPALVVGALAGRRIYTTGWVSWRDMLILVAVMSLLGAAFITGVGGEVSLRRLTGLAAAFAIPTALNAMILRGLIVGFGVLRKPD